MKTILQTALAAAATLLFIAPAAEADYWISSSGKTHNSTCRYYRKCTGQLSSTPSGKNCKLCKGATKAAPPAAPDRKPEGASQPQSKAAQP